MPKRLTQKEAEEKVRNYNSEYELISEYKTQNDLVILRHKCGNEYSCKFKTFFEGKNKCPKCYSKCSSKDKKRINKVTEEILKERITKQVGEEYEYVSDFTTMDKKCLFKHNECGNIFSVAPKMFLGVKQTRCPFCSNMKRGKHLRDENYLENILKNSIDGNEYEWLGKYNFDNKEKIEIYHKKCNNSYKVRPNDFQQGYRCPICALKNIESKQMRYIKKILDENDIEYKTEITFEGLKYKNSLYYDILIGNIIIEYDGIQHFKECNNFGDFKTNKIRDNIKNEWIKNQDKYYLLRIHPELDNQNILEITNSIINNDLDLLLELVDKYKLYFFNIDNKQLYNENVYYTNINDNYYLEE